MELEEFLKSKGALVSFCKNVRRDTNLRMSTRTASIDSFYWVDTVEGYSYWYDLYHDKKNSNKPYVYYATHECLKPPKSFKVI